MQKDLVQGLVDTGVLRSPHIIEAFLHVDRADFVPDNARKEAHIDAPLSIGYGQTISQPWTVAFMLEQLAPRTGQHILDIGSGSGWQTALLSFIVSHDEFGKEVDCALYGRVISIERIPELAQFAIKNVSKYSFIKKHITEIHCLNAQHGFEKEAPFDRIVAAASASSIPDAWKEQLKKDGVIVMPVDTSVVVIKKGKEGTFTEEKSHGFSFVPFIDEEDGRQDS